MAAAADCDDDANCKLEENTAEVGLMRHRVGEIRYVRPCVFVVFAA